MFNYPIMALSMAFAVVLSAQGVLAATAEDEETSKPYGGAPHPIPGKIEAEHYDEGKPGIAYYDVTEENEGADYRPDTQVDIEARPDASNLHGIGWTRTDEWLNYTVEVMESGSYTIFFPVASRKEGGIFHLEIAGKDVSGPIKVPDTGGWDKLEMIQVEGVELEEGVQILRMVMDEQGPSGSIGDIDYMDFRKEPLEQAADEAN